MRVVLAPQTFKGSLSALEVARAMRDGVRWVVPGAETVLVPVADGGDGTLETLVEATGGEIRRCEVTGPLGPPVAAAWGALGDGETAVVEMARSSGLALVPRDELDPRVATTRGLGEVLVAALDGGFRRFIVGLGGSATNDAGAGMAQALGVRLLDRGGDELAAGGAALADLERIDASRLDRRIASCELAAACDVSNPLTGSEGASAVYGPQKGATPETVAELDRALKRFAAVAKRDLGADVDRLPGAGAAGGLGGGLVAFLGATLRPGVDIVLDAVGLERHLEGADLVITGEGRLDFQTVYDKAPVGVARRAKEHGVPVIAVCGSLGERFTDVHDHGIDAASAIVQAPETSLEETSENAAELVASATEQAMRYLEVGARVFGAG